MERVLRLTSIYILVCILRTRLIYVLAINTHRHIRISPLGTDSPDCLDQTFASADCETLDYVLTQIQNNATLGTATKIVIKRGVHALDRSYSFESLDNFHITGDQLSGSSVVIQCKMGSGLAIWRSKNLVFSYLTFQYCGSWQNNTSIKHPRFLAAIFIVYSKNLKLINCHILKSPGVGVNLYDVVGEVTIEKCMFAENYAVDSWNFTYGKGKVRAGGGLHVEFTYCGALYPFECDDLETDKYNNGSNYTIRNCNFTGNNGATSAFMQTFDIYPCEKNFNSIGRGGGISFIIKGNATGNRFFVDHCTFLGNTADWGAGYAIYFQDNATNNFLSVTSSRFIENRARYGGGAVKWSSTIFGSFLDLISRKPNYYLHKNCTFERNTASQGWGGAFSAYGFTGYLGARGWKVHKTPEFVDCDWRENSATAGAAIGALTKSPELWRKSIGHEEQGFGYAIKLINNNFTKNFITSTKSNLTVFGMGTIYTVYVPIIMSGDVKFINNSNTALLLDSACAEIDGNVLFHQNNGVYGGGVGLYGPSSFLLNRGSKLNFKDNTASVAAGAIYVKTNGPNIAAFYNTIFQRHRCFFTYFDRTAAPNDWNVSVVFQGNKASMDIGRTLFADTLQFCRFGHTGFINHAIKGWSSFTFLTHDGFPSKDDLEVATDPVQIVVDSYEWSNIAPNEQFSPSIQLLDERNHSVYGLVKVSVEERSRNTPVSIQHGISPYFFVKDRISSLWFNGKPSGKFQASITTIYSQSIKKVLKNLTMKKCPPGFVNRANTCVCSMVENIGISRCGQDGKSLYLRKGYWGGPLDSNPSESKSCSFSVVQCPYGYCKCRSDSKKGLINQCECYFNQGVNQCAKGRKGILCGECEKNLSVVMGSFECRPCKKNALSLFLFFLILTILVLLILCFKLDFFSGYLNCWLYSYQIIFLLLPNDFVAGDPVMNFLLRLTNMKFAFGSWCIWDGMNDLQKTSFGYVAPVFQILVLYLFVKFSSKLSIFQGNFFRPFCTILVLSYSGIVDVTFKQLQPVYICSEFRVYLYAKQKLFSGEHIIHAALAILVLVFVILPFPGFLACSSVFTNRSRRLSRIIMPLLDVLKSCYRPNRSWFASYYIVCRLVAVLLYSYVPEISTRHKVLQMFSLAVLLLFLYINPYRSNILTKIDTFFLSFVLFVSLLAEVVITCSFFVTLFHKVCGYCIHVLLYVPLVYSLVLLYYHTRNLIRNTRRNSVNSSNGHNSDETFDHDVATTRYEP